MLQDIEKEFHNEYYLYPPKDEDMVFVFKEGKVLTRGPKPYIHVKDITPKMRENLLYLFVVGDISAFLWYPPTPPEIEGEYKKSFEIRWDDKVAEEDIFYLFTARHLYVWYNDNRFCGRCGKPLEIGKNERCLTCSCGNIVFPKIAPAIIAGVRNGDKLLMTRYSNRPYTGWALIGGFCEIGETVETTVKREVLEETGLKVKNITYFGSQPWGTDQNLLVGCFCDLDGEDVIHIDKNELAVGQWFERKEVPAPRSTMSLTATMIEAFRNGIDK